MKYLKLFETAAELGNGEIPFDTLLVVEVSLIERINGKYEEKDINFAGWCDSKSMPNDISIWKGSSVRGILIGQIKKY